MGRSNNSNRPGVSPICSQIIRKNARILNRARSNFVSSVIGMTTALGQRRSRRRRRTSAIESLPVAWAVMIADRYLEQYEFSCGHCSYIWRETFEVREIEDSQGGSWHYFYLAGSPAASPSMRNVCPSCKRTSAQHRQIDRHQILDRDDL
jgi:hypothetical protein